MWGSKSFWISKVHLNMQVAYNGAIYALLLFSPPLISLGSTHFFFFFCYLFDFYALLFTTTNQHHYRPFVISSISDKSWISTIIQGVLLIWWQGAGWSSDTLLLILSLSLTHTHIHIHARIFLFFPLYDSLSCFHYFDLSLSPHVCCIFFLSFFKKQLYIPPLSLSLSLSLLSFPVSSSLLALFSSFVFSINIYYLISFSHDFQTI